MLANKVYDIVLVSIRCYGCNVLNESSGVPGIRGRRLYGTAELTFKFLIHGGIIILYGVSYIPYSV